jgi:hypothetical protein
MLRETNTKPQGSAALIPGQGRSSAEHAPNPPTITRTGEPECRIWDSFNRPVRRSGSRPGGTGPAAGRRPDSVIMKSPLPRNPSRVLRQPDSAIMTPTLITETKPRRAGPGAPPDLLPPIFTAPNTAFLSSGHCAGTTAQGRCRAGNTRSAATQGDVADLQDPYRQALSGMHHDHPRRVGQRLAAWSLTCPAGAGRGGDEAVV